MCSFLFHKIRKVKTYLLLTFLAILFLVIPTYADTPASIEADITAMTDVQAEPPVIVETFIESPQGDTGELTSHYILLSGDYQNDNNSAESATGEDLGSGEVTSTSNDTDEEGYIIEDTPIITETILEGQGVTITTGINAGIFSGDAGSTGSEAAFMPYIILPKISFVQDSKGRIDPLTLQSYNYETSDITYCSAITRSNLEWITGLPSKNGLSLTGVTIAKGDASVLIQQGINDDLFLDMISGFSFTGENGSSDILTRDSVTDYIIQRFTNIIQESDNTVFDVYVYNEEQLYKDGSVNLNAGHRITVLLGNDNLLYVLDPVRISTVEPLLLSDYIDGFIYPTEKILLYKYGYRPYKEEISGDNEQGDIASPSLCQTIFSGAACPSYIKGKANISIADKEISVDVKKDMKGRIREIMLLDDTVVSNQGMGISVTIEKDTKVFSPIVGELTGEIMTDSRKVEETTKEDAEFKSGDVNTTGEDLSGDNRLLGKETFPEDIIDPLAGQDSFSSVDFLLQDNTQKEENNKENIGDGETIEKERSFVFGLEDQHLVFTKPVMITVDVPDKKDGELIIVQVKHVGDESFGNVGISVDSSTLCLPDGTTTLPGDIAEVVRGKAVFYTCGASTFSLGYVPAIALPNAAVSAIEIQTDEKIIIGGSFTTVGGVARNYIARINPDKSLDKIFNPNANNTVSTIAIQSDGRILIGGAFTSVGGVTRNRMARLNTDGTLDTTFNPDVNNTVSSIAVQSDGKVLIGGTFTTVGGTTRNRIARLNTDGTLDTTFNPNVANTVSSIVVQSDGKVLIGGTFTTVGGTTRNRIARVNTDGTLDTSFNPNANNVVNTIAIQSDGKILIGGTFSNVGGTARNRIARLNADGTLDTSFNPNANNVVNTIALQSDGKVLIGGTFSSVGGTARKRIARVNADGTLDTTFNPNANSTVTAIQVNTTGKIFIGGAFTTINTISQGYFSIMEDDIHNTTYNVRPNGIVNILLPQNDGKILMGGAFTSVGGTTRNRIARLNVDGTLDIDFDPNIGGAVNTMVLQSDGKNIVGGAFTSVGGTTRNRIARLNTDGTLDTTFNPNANSAVSAISLQADEKIIIGGGFTTIGGITRNRIARLNTDGTLDTTFNPNANNTVNTIIVQSDGKILVGGAFTSVGGVTRNRIARLNTDGTLDTTFNPNANNTVNTIIVQDDGKILVGGAFTSVGGVTRNRIARLNTDGTLDTTFNPNANNTVNTIYIFDDSVFIGGAFTSVGGVATTEIARLNAGGELDTMFSPTLGAAGTAVLTMVQDGSGNLLFGGSFTTVNGGGTNPYIAWIGLTFSPENMALWLKADVGLNCMTHNCNITSWNDQSLNERDGTVAIGGGGYVRYDSGAVLNFNPTVHLNNAQITFANPAILNNFTVFYIMSGADISPGTALFEDTATSMRFAQWNNTKKYGFTRYGITDHVSTISTQWNTWQILRYNSANANTMDLWVQTPTTILEQIGWSIGAVSNLSLARFSSTTTNAIGNFNIAEIVVYAGQLSASNLDKIVSYLSLKYGFTIDQSGVGGKNYVLSNDTISRSAASAGIYNKNIAGIMRDDGFSLVQRKSQSISDTSDIIVEVTGGIANMQGVMWANNGASKSVWTTTELNTDVMTNRVSRERGFQEVGGSMGNLVVRIPTTSLPSYTPLVGEQMVMLVDSDGNFATGSSLITGSLVSGYYEFVAPIPHGYYITFGYKKGGLGALCIEAPTTFTIGNIATTSTTQSIEVLSDYFTVDDQRGALSGYYTTVSISSLTGSSGGVIPTSAIQWKANPISLLSGTLNTGVIIDPIMSSYHTVGGVDMLLKRNPGVNSGILGKYGTKLSIKVTIPPYVPLGTYTGNITYTLYQN